MVITVSPTTVPLLQATARNVGEKDVCSSNRQCIEHCPSWALILSYLDEFANPPGASNLWRCGRRYIVGAEARWAAPSATFTIQLLHLGHGHEPLGTSLSVCCLSSGWTYASDRIMHDWIKGEKDIRLSVDIWSLLTQWPKSETPGDRWTQREGHHYDNHQY